MKSKYFFQILGLLLITILFSQELTEEQIEKNAQEQLAAMLQYTAKFRFSKNLDVGDKVVYKRLDKKDSEISLEVTKKTTKGIWIKEKFDKNEVNLLIELTTMQVMEIWGYDEENIYQKPSLLSNQEVEEKIEELSKNFKDSNIVEKWNISQESMPFNISKKKIVCSILKPEIKMEYKLNMSISEIRKVKKDLEIYLSDEVPKMYPIMTFAIQTIFSGKTFQDITYGFVKNEDLELTEFFRSEKIK